MRRRIRSTAKFAPAIPRTPRGRNERPAVRHGVGGRYRLVRHRVLRGPRVAGFGHGPRTLEGRLRPFRCTSCDATQWHSAPGIQHRPGTRRPAPGIRHSFGLVRRSLVADGRQSPVHRRIAPTLVPCQHRSPITELDCRHRPETGDRRPQAAGCRLQPEPRAIRCKPHCSPSWKLGAGS